MQARIWIQVSILAAVVLLGNSLLAQSKTPIELFNEASDLAEQGRLEEAIAIWVMVTEDIPDKYKPVVQVNLGLAYQKLEKLPEAWYHMMRYLEKKEDSEVDGWRQELEKKLVKTHKMVSIKCEPDKATIYIQSSAGNSVPYRCPINFWFAPGKHPVRITKEGYERRLELLDISKTMSAPEIIVKLEAKTEFGSLQVQGNARAVQVFIDGKLEGTVPFNRKLAVGTYELMVGRPGKMPWKKRIAIEAGKTIIETPDLAQKDKPAPVDPIKNPGTDPINPDKTITQKQEGGGIPWWTFTIIGGGAVAIGGGATMLGLASKRNKDLRAKYPDGTSDNPQPISNQENYQKGYDNDVQPMLAGGYVLMGVGVAAAVTGTILMVVKPGRDKGSKKTAAPMVLQDGGGMTFTLSF
jgi:hypothetical protein